MKPQTLEAWQVYAARCRRLDAEAAKAAPTPWWMSTRVEIIGAVLAAEALLLAAVAGLW